MSSRALALLLLACPAHAELKLEQFDNSALSGAPASTSTVPTLDFQLADVRGSAELTGLLTYDETTNFAFDCSFTGGQIVFVWVEDHLVCHTRPVPFGNTPSSTDGSPEYPLRGKKGAQAALVIHVYSYSKGGGVVTSNATAGVSVRWARLVSPMKAGSAPAYEAVPASALSPESSAAEVERRSLQKGLQQARCWLAQTGPYARPWADPPPRHTHLSHACPLGAWHPVEERRDHVPPRYRRVTAALPPRYRRVTAA